MKKRLMSVSLAFLLVLPVVLAADVIQTLQNVWDKILGIGNLSFLGFTDAVMLAGFTRLMLGILIFAIFFAVITGLKGFPPMKYFGRGQAGIIAAVLAIMSVVYLPKKILLATGTGWATIIALLLIGGPIVGMAYLLWQIPGKGKETKWTVVLKIIILLALFWVLTAMKHHVGGFV